MQSTIKEDLKVDTQPVSTDWDKHGWFYIFVRISFFLWVALLNLITMSSTWVRVTAVMENKVCELTEVTPLSLGVGCDGDVMGVLIPRNSHIPTKKEGMLDTVFDNQTSMDLPVYQSERSKYTKNYLLGEFYLLGLPPSPQGEVKVTLCYELDENGILNVLARELTSGRNNTINITNTRSLSKAEIDKMTEDTEIFKIEDEAHMKKGEARNGL